MMTKRRLNREGSISFNTSKGLWVATITHEGKRLFRYGGTKKAVMDKLNALKRKQDDGIQLVSSGMSMKDYLNGWLEMVKPTLRHKTYDAYESFTRVHLIPRLGHIKLNKLAPEHINRAWSRMLKEGHSATLVQHCHLRLSKALHDAEDRKLIANNPMQFVAKLRVEAKEVNPLSLEEIPQVLEVAKGTEYYSIIHTALHTGMRRNELLGLRWKDINLEEAVLHLSRSIYRAKGGVTEHQTTKTKSGNRPIDLTPSSAIVLRKQWELQKGEAILHGYKMTGNSPVFIRTTGEPLLPYAVTHGFKQIVRKLGLDDVRFHDLRHTHATIMLLQGVHPKVVQERLGHSKMSTTMDLYSHVMPSMQKDAVQRFDMALETLR